MPELGVKPPPRASYIDLRERAEAACKTLNLLKGHGAAVSPPTDADKTVASTLVHAYAENPEKASKAIKATTATQVTPASLILVKGILDEFGHVVLESSIRVRNLVTNKLLLETENPDARIRLRALELLGKISDVGLFSDKSEVTITHQSSDELKDKLRAKLARLVNPDEEAEDAVIIEQKVSKVNIDAAFDDE